MHSLGNDFVIIDLITQKVRLHAAHLKRIADRNFGVGCDQILTVEPPTKANSDFSYRTFNADGHEAEQCGNGARCVAKFVYDIGLVNKRKLRANSAAGTVNFKIELSGMVAVSFGPTRSEISTDKITINNAEYQLYQLSFGNPHAVLEVADVATLNLNSFANKLNKSSVIKSETNIGFMEIVNRDEIKLRVHERGVGETFACGSGACAAVIVGIWQNKLSNKVKVSFKHGDLEVKWNGKHTPVRLTGPTLAVFSGSLRI